jgi:uncharacterized protein YidB (DUF937 family)
MSEKGFVMGTLVDTSKIIEAASNNREHQSLAVEAVRMLTSGQGGLSALAQSFDRNGLGHIIGSWIGSGTNAPISPDQVKTVIGNDRLSELAKKVGISPDTVSQYLSKSLPNVVDALTPSGKVGEAGDLLSRGREILAALSSSKSSG